MPIRDHVVSYRNGPQVMVAGLRLQDMGYCRGAQVEITDPTGNSANMSWEFVVSNDEHATLVCRNPPPPGWIQPNVRIQIEVRPPTVGGAAGALAKSAPRSPGDLASALPEVSTLELALPQPRPGLPPRVIYAVDVGAPGGGLAWARLAPHAAQIPPAQRTMTCSWNDSLATCGQASLWRSDSRRRCFCLLHRPLVT